MAEAYLNHRSFSKIAEAYQRPLESNSHGDFAEMRLQPAGWRFDQLPVREGRMPHTFAKTMFSEPSKRLQARYGSRAQYENMARSGAGEQKLGADEAEFIAARDSFYIASVTPEGWPYVQHRGGPAGFLRVMDPQTLAFADYSGNKQYITAGNLAVNDRVCLFLMDYPNRTRLKVIGHAKLSEPGADPALESRLHVAGQRARIERIFRIEVVGFDWNCSQHITPRYTREELEEFFPSVGAAR